MSGIVVAAMVGGRGAVGTVMALVVFGLGEGAEAVVFGLGGFGGGVGEG